MDETRNARWTRPWRALPVWLRRVVVAIVGGALVLVGVALLVLPGPGLVVIGLGVGVLAMEFAWPRQLLLRALAKVEAIRGRGGRGSAGRR